MTFKAAQKPSCLILTAATNTTSEGTLKMESTKENLRQVCHVLKVKCSSSAYPVRRRQSTANRLNKIVKMETGNIKTNTSLC